MKDIKYPKGYKSRPGFTKLAVVFPDELFRGVMRMAQKEKREFNELLIELINIGKFDIEESDRHEPKKGKKRNEGEQPSGPGA